MENHRGRRLARRILGGLGLLVAILVVLVLGFAWMLRPPRSPVPSQDFEISDVTLVEPGIGRSHHRSLIVHEGRIERIETARPGAGRYSGATVLPGLIDLHVHHPPVVAVGERSLFALLFLAHGVTTVRDMGSAFPRTLQRHARAIERGEIPGPRVLACGPFVDGEPPDWPLALIVRNAAEGRAAVEALKKRGSHCAKLYNALSPAALQGILETAEALELPVVGHVPWAVGLEALQGVEIQHLMGLSHDWHAIASAQVADYVELSRSLGIRHTPTLVTFARAAQLFDPDSVENDPVGRLLPSYYRKILWRIDRNGLAMQQMWTHERIDQMKRLVADLHAAGVPVLAGTDTMNPLVAPGASLHEELRLLSAAGLTIEAAWAAATTHAGAATGIPLLGRLVPGAPADFLVFREDPTKDLDALDTLEAVVAAGRIYPKKELDREASRSLDHFESVPYAPLSRTASQFGVEWLSSGRALE